MEQTGVALHADSLTSDTYDDNEENKVNESSSIDINNNKTELKISSSRSPVDDDYDLGLDDVDVDVEIWSEKGITFMDQVTFFISVGNFTATMFFVAGYQYIMPWFYSAKLPILVLGRFFHYKSYNWHWFLLDFCYFANLLLCIYLWILPKNETLFIVVFSLVNGPLLAAIVVFGNALVFHSIDKTTSLLIHITPVFVSYCIRWFDLGNYYFISSDTNPSFLYTLVLPTGFFLLHQLLYFVLMQIVCRETIKKQANALTTYRYLFRHRSGAAYRLISCAGPKLRPIMFGMFFTIFAAVTMIPTYWYYQYWALHFSVICIAAACSVWNGAVFYSKAMNSAGKDKKKTKKSSE